MAKFIGVIGAVRGKVGTMVFAKGENGISYGKAYQPNVANPRTPAQLSQRAKANLAGRISKAAPAKMLAALGGSKRWNRSEFCSEILKAAVVTSNNGEYTASVPSDAIIFSKGAETLNASGNAFAINENKLTYSLTLQDTSLGGKYGERLIIGVVRPEDKGGVSYFKMRDILFPAAEGTAQPIEGEVNFAQPLVDGTMVVVWRAPFVLSENGVTLSTESVYNDDDELMAKLLSSPSKNFRGWGDSVVFQQSVFTEA